MSVNPNKLSEKLATILDTSQSIDRRSDIMFDLYLDEIRARDLTRVKVFLKKIYQRVQGDPVKFQAFYSMLLGKLLIEAAKLNFKEGLVFVLEQPGSNVNYQDESGTALSVAVWEGHTEIVQELLKYGADPNLEGPIFSAILNENMEIFNLLLNSSDIKVRKKSPQLGLSPFLWAVHLGLPVFVKKLIDSKKVDVNEFNEKHQENALYLAFGSYFHLRENDSSFDLYKGMKTGRHAKLNDLQKSQKLKNLLECVAILIKENININLKNFRGITPLNIAFSLILEKELKLLLEKGAKVEEGFFQIEITPDRKECFKLLLSAFVKQSDFVLDKPLTCDWKTPLMLACELGLANLARELITRGANPNHSLEDGMCPLLFAAHAGQSEVVKVLLEPQHKVNIEAKTNQEVTAVLFVANNCDFRSLTLLLGSRANFLQKNRKGFGVLLQAAAQPYSEVQFKVVQFLLDIPGIKETLNDLTEGGITIVHVVAKYGNTKLLKLLLEQGASSDLIVEKTGLSPLMIAAQEGHLETVKILLKHSTKSLNLSCLLGLGAIGYAKNVAIVNLLKSFGSTQSPVFCQLNVIAYEARKIGIEKLKEFLTIVNVTETFHHPLTDSLVKLIVPEFPILPIYLFSNLYKNKEARALILQQKWMVEFEGQFNKDLDRNSVSLFAELLDKSCDDFSFSIDGRLCLTFKNKIRRHEKTYKMTLSNDGAQAIFLNLTKHSVQKMSLEKQCEFIKEQLIKYSEEKKLVQEEEEIENLKNEMIVCLMRASNQVSGDLAEIERLKLAVQKLNYPSASGLAEQEKTCLDYIEQLQNLGKKVQDLRQSSNKEKLNSCLSEIQGVAELQKTLRESLKQFSVELQAFEENKAATAQVQSGYNKKQSKHRRQKGKPADLSKYSSSQPLPQDKEKTTETKVTAEKIHPKTITLQVMVAREDKVFKESQQITRVQPKGKPYVPPVINMPDYFSEDRSFSEYRQYLKPPAPPTLESMTNLGARLKAKEGANDFQNVIATLEDQAEGECKIELETALQMNALKAGLAHALETRRELKEQWPNHIRNVLFHHEDFLQKHFSEGQLMRIIPKIQEKIRGISEDDLRKSAGKLTLEQIDEEGFLKTMSQVEIPVCTKEKADSMIQLSETELKKYAYYIVRKGEAAKKSASLIMGIGFALARLGTFKAEHQRLLQEQAPLKKSKYDPFIIVGNEFRHYDSNWKEKVQKFIEQCLNTELGQSQTVVGNLSSLLTAFGRHQETSSMVQPRPKKEYKKEKRQEFR